MKCAYINCNIFNAIFGIKGEGKYFCLTHKTSEMIDLKNKRCKYEGCKSQPAFNIKGGTAIMCSKHKTENMINVKHKRCEYEGCNSINPIFDIKGGKGRYCVKHRLSKMIDVKNKKCNYKDCDSQPCFDVKGGKGIYCFKHKKDGMIDVKNLLCEYEGCNIRPNFNIIGSKKGKYCSIHKKPDMIDLINKRCIHKDCDVCAIYGKPGFPKSHCYKHRITGMIRRSNCKCMLCKEPAIYGSNWIAKHCELHKIANEINLIESPCSNCGLINILDNNNLCEFCNPELFTRAYLAKQNALMNYLDARNLKGNTTDKTIENGICGKERPDRVYDFGDKIIILECDENQHYQRDCSCEQIRMVNIGQSYGGIPVYFIRWNPDNYSTQNDKKRPEIITKRYKILGDLINSIQIRKTLLPNALVSALYMYYDGWQSLSNEKWHIITPI